MILILIAEAAGEKEETEAQIKVLESMADTEWCCATTLGDICAQRQEYDRAIEWYRKGQEIQPKPSIPTAQEASRISARFAAITKARSLPTRKRSAS